ncbi:MAG: sodium:proton antiporter [Ardenticatenaceae bacterium]|nr:sodium:proton antiporter [Ardenticatenaceae bacterium]
MHENLLVSFGIIIVLAMGAQWIAWRLRLPSILFLLIFGFVAGPITNVLHIDDLIGELLFPLVSVAVGIILFEGGLSLKLSELPHIGVPTGRLITVGALITWAIASWGAFSILNLDLTLSVLLGAILIVTGPTVVTPLLRQIHPKGRVGSLLKWEGILIDPVGALIAVLVFEGIITGNFTSIEAATSTIFIGVLRTILEGGGLGLLAAAFLVFVLQRYWLPDYLQNGVTLMMVIGVFALANTLQPEAGLVATTVMGIAMANQERVSITRILEFTEDLQILLIGTLFIILSARVSLDNLLAVMRLPGLLFLLLLIFVVRPISVLISTWFTDLNWRERAFIAWLAPRGIVAASVASVFAFELNVEGYAGADQIAAYTFMIIVGTVVIYSLTSGWVARRLDLAEEHPQGVLIVGADRVAVEIGKAVRDLGFEALLVDNNQSHIREARRAGLRTFYGSALSEKTSIDLDLSGIGRLLALTPNNEVNSLASLHFSDEFGRAEVYQLYAEPVNGSERRSTNLHGRFLFDKQLVHEKALELIETGGEIKTIPIDEEFTLDALHDQYEDEAYPLFLFTEQGQLNINTLDVELLPKSGQKLVILLASADSAQPRMMRTNTNHSAADEEIKRN